MPADVTPTPASQSYLANVAFDVVGNRAGPFPATTTSVSTGPAIMLTDYSGPIITAITATNQFTATTVYKTTYSTGGASSVTTYVGAVSTPVTVVTQNNSFPITFVNTTEYFIVNSTNTTVFNSQNSAVSLLASGLADVVNLKVAVVSNSTF